MQSCGSSIAPTKLAVPTLTSGDLALDVAGTIDAVDNAVSAATSKARKATKSPETLEDAKQRILAMKLNAAERGIVESVFTWLSDGRVQRSPASKRALSKREIFELYAQERENERERKRRYVVETRPDNYWIVQDVATLQRLDALLALETEIGVDTETTGLDIYNDKIVGYSVCLPSANIAAYVPFGHTTGQAQVSEGLARDVIERHLRRSDLRTIFHNASYDLHMFKTMWDLDVANVWWDTLRVAKLLNEHEPSHRLKALHDKYCAHGELGAIMFDDLFDDAVIYDKDVILAGIYAAGDAHKTYQLYAFQRPHIDKTDRLNVVWYSIEQRLLSVDLRMERTGFRIDVEHLAALEAQMEPRLQEAEQALRDAFNIDEAFVLRMIDAGYAVDDFNVNSNQHLGYLLYDVLGCDENIGLRFKKARRSTAAEVLDALVEDVAELAPLKEYRRLYKLLHTYIKRIPTSIEPATGRLHSSFINLGGRDSGDGGTATGRYSSSEHCSAKHSRTGDTKKGQNLQNLSAKGEGSEVRRAFIPDDGSVLISADLSAIEPRIISVILAEQYGDTSMQRFYVEGRDLYTEMAMQTFSLDREYCVDGAYDPTHTFQPRKLTKQGVLSYLYGTSAKSFATKMGVSDDVAARFFDSMIRAFPGLQTFRDDVIRQLLTRGTSAYGETLFGRKRRFPDYRTNYAELQRLNRVRRDKMTQEQRERRNELWRKCATAERQALNAIVQGSAADVLKQNMIAVDAWCVKNGYQMNATVHDELILTVPKRDLTPALIDDIRRLMTETVTFSTPLKTDIAIMERWGDECRPDDWDYVLQRPKTKGVA